MPAGGHLGKIGCADMGRHRVPLLGRQGGPRWPLAVPATKPSVSLFAVWACILVDQQEPAIADDAADLAHQGQFRRGEEVVQGQTDPRDIHGLGPIAQRIDEITSVERHRANERLKSLARQIQRRLGKIDPVVMRYARSLSASTVALASPQAISKNRKG